MTKSLFVFRVGLSRVAHSAIPPVTDFRFRIPLRLKTIKDIHSVSAYNSWTIYSVFRLKKLAYIGLFRHSANLETPPFQKDLLTRNRSIFVAKSLLRM